MNSYAIERLLGLCAATTMTVIAIALLLRGTRSRHAADVFLIAGYPQRLYPDKHVSTSAPLTTLAATQERLLTMYACIPASSDSAIWLRTFLRELREIMDTAYRVALATQVYGGQGRLDRLVEEVGEVELEVIDHIARRMLHADGDAQQELLAARVDTLRLCAHELALPAGTYGRYDKTRR